METSLGQRDHGESPTASSQDKLEELAPTQEGSGLTRDPFKRDCAPRSQAGEDSQLTWSQGVSLARGDFSVRRLETAKG